MRIVQDSPTARRNFGGRRCYLRLHHGHLLLLDILLGLNDGNVFAGGVKGRSDLGLLLRDGQALVDLELGHEIVNLNAKGLLSVLDFSVKEEDVGL